MISGERIASLNDSHCIKRKTLRLVIIIANEYYAN